MKTNKCCWYLYTFEDGYEVSSRGYGKTEMDHLILKHGKLISRVFECIA